MISGSSVFTAAFFVSSNVCNRNAFNRRPKVSHVRDPTSGMSGKSGMPGMSGMSGKSKCGRAYPQTLTSELSNSF